MIALSWSGGKDSALALDQLRKEGRAPELLLTTVDEDRGVVAHHDVPQELLRRQAASVGLPLVEVLIPSGTSNNGYARRMSEAFEGPLSGVTQMAFGDLFLEDLRAFREQRMVEIGREAIFPLWGKETAVLAREFVDRFQATVCAIDRDQLSGVQPGVAYDGEFLDRLPPEADPCGENGEFHTFVSSGPGFEMPVDFSVGGTRRSEDRRFIYASLVPGAE